MANSSLFLGIKNMVAAKLGTSDVKLALGTKLLYPLSKPINDAVVTCDSAIYNGRNQVAQNIVVTLSGVTLVSGTDYTVTNNTGGTNAGSYSVTVSGTGNYEGSASGTFTINKANQSAPTATGATTTYNTTATATASGGGGQGSLEWESTQSQTSVGSHSTRARWSGNDNYNASSWSNEVTLTVDYHCVDGHAYVEIAGIKWATMNIGATRITDTGLYFQWGDTQGYTADQVGSGEGQKYFGWADYKYGNGTSYPNETGMTKYNATDGKTILEAADDVVRANWGSSWRMPTTDECNILCRATNSAWTADYHGSGVAGVVCTDKIDSTKKLFFPACGLFYDGYAHKLGRQGYYWSSSLYSNNVQYSYYWSFYNGSRSWDINQPRYNGYPVRGVVG